MEPPKEALMSTNEVVRARIADEKRLPFPARAPNAPALKAMKELDEGEGRHFSDAEDLY